MSNPTDSLLRDADAPCDDFGLGRDPLSDKTAFPWLTEIELAEVAPFGERCSFARNEPLFGVGDYPRRATAWCSSAMALGISPAISIC
jgi:hypothetical protein